MKKLFLTLALVVLFSMSASAQDIKPFNIYVGGGLTLPQSDLDDSISYKNGFHLLGGIGFNFAPMIQVGGKLEYFSMDVDDADLEGTGLSVSTNAMMYGVTVKLQPKAPMMPIKVFGLVGLGMASIEHKIGFDAGFISFGTSTGRTSKFYYEFGAGVELGKFPLPFFVMARYIGISTEGQTTSFIPITVGLKF